MTSHSDTYPVQVPPAAAEDILRAERDEPTTTVLAALGRARNAFTAGESVELGLNSTSIENAAFGYAAGMTALRCFVKPEDHQKITNAFNDSLAILLRNTGSAPKGEKIDAEVGLTGMQLALANAYGALSLMASTNKVLADQVEWVTRDLGGEQLKLGNRMTRNRRATNHIKEAVAESELVKLIPDLGNFKTLTTFTGITLSAFDSMLKINTAGVTLSTFEDNTSISPLLSVPRTQRTIKACRATESELIKSLLETGHVDFKRTLDHFETTSSLLDELLDSDMPASLRTKLENRERAYELYWGQTKRLEGFMGLSAGKYESHLQMLSETLGTIIADAVQAETGSVQSQPQDVKPAPIKTAEPDPELLQKQTEELAELINQHTLTMDKLTDLRAPYSASMKSLRSSGLNSLLHDLQKGLEDKDNNLFLNGISRPDAQRTIQTLYGFMKRRQLAEDSEAFRVNSSHELALEMQLVESIGSLRNQLRVRGTNGFEHLDTDLCNTFEWLGNNKAAVQAIIANNLPTKLAVDYKNLLEELLFIPGETTPEEPVEEPIFEPEVEIEPETEEPLPEFDVDDLLPKLPLQEHDVALQLDWEVFPADITIEDIRERVKGVYKDGDAAQIEWTRISDLLQISQAYDGTVYRAKPRALGTVEPYFVVEAEIEGKKFIIAENPQYGNATYILRADRAYDGASWQEIFEQSRQFARLLGAERLVHSNKRTHLERIMSNIQSQILIKVDA